ncbi:FadR/GntR family transcriptional regulator [Pseudoroseomonas cervicalis]|uniref:FadR/GntR family transcriptional regulator n=1 Tax=Teichococcus cervicalis TaxID=204525 RepID=UPI0022F1795F|nr:FCD domain-containing protein [Pseudoroseomonas cervicalis]WBV44843.1 FCD domain-containing protein [Pseudoroseomonas cervicalis]
MPSPPPQRPGPPPDAAPGTPAAAPRGTPVMALLQGYLANTPLPPDGQLPPERILAAALGISRAELRKALAAMEAEGQIWRHVGKGTFLGARPLAATGDVAQLAARAGLPDVMAARRVLEPQLAALAAGQADAAQRAALLALARPPARPLSWREFESQDAALHRAIAEAAGNLSLLHVFDLLAAMRRALTWSRPRPRPEGPPPDHHSFAEHGRIAAAIAAGDAAAAAAEMQAHVEAVRRHLPD